ncbi:DNA polymerase Y family protein [Psychromicrobium sp. YIM B11713]|uniref:DNA polymerase Y family protein n=1 Tax=Psychromicrobium sp. YIM B11713 TaxID=3145233 RepID=UPI00374E7D01
MKHRALVLWCPDWPISAVLQEQAHDPETPLALVKEGEIFACSSIARLEGVKRGLTVREAQSRCPRLQVLPYDPAVDARVFAPVIAAIEQIMPGVQVIRPGTCAIRAKGPARYFGGEQQAAEVLRSTLLGLGVRDVRVGIADGIFAAEQAARKTSNLRIVEPGASAEFLSRLGLDVLEQTELVSLLERLGLQTLGDFAALTTVKVRNRFGEDGARAHLLARGLDPRAVVPRTPPTNFEVFLNFEPPLDRVDQLAFAVKTSAERFIEAITAAGLVCTALRIQLQSDSGEHLEKVWKHPRFFDPEDVLDRVRWQLQSNVKSSADWNSELDSGITKVVLSPETTDQLSSHTAGLWGNGPQERVHHGLSRIQNMLGHSAVLTAVLTGGRMLAQRSVLIPWGDSTDVEPASKSRQQPWPGAVSGPLPATLFEAPLQVHVKDAQGQRVELDERLELSGDPAFFAPPRSDDSGEAEERLINAWAGPWPVDERWWEASGQQLYRFQIIDSTNSAWLLFHRDGQWFAEASYD